MRIIIEDDKLNVSKSDEHEMFNELLAAIERFDKRIYSLEVNLKTLDERMNSEERPQIQWDAIELIESHVDQIVSRLDRAEKMLGEHSLRLFNDPISPVDETPDLHTDL